jgi:dCMP deaminase
MSRPTIDEYLMQIAFAASTRSTCLRAKVGAVISFNGKILATGYNGSVAGLDHCTDIGCQLENGRCVRSIHAEVNAVLQAQQSLLGATVYCTHRPCFNCTKILLQAGIARIVYAIEYDAGSAASEIILQKGVKIEKLGFPCVL